MVFGVDFTEEALDRGHDGIGRGQNAHGTLFRVVTGDEIADQLGIVGDARGSRVERHAVRRCAGCRRGRCALMQSSRDPGRSVQRRQRPSLLCYGARTGGLSLSPRMSSMGQSFLRGGWAALRPPSIGMVARSASPSAKPKSIRLMR